MSVVESPMPGNIAELEAMLPPPPNPIGSYVPVVQTGNLVMTSGALPLQEGKLYAVGPVGSYTVTVEQGREAARLCALNCLSAIKAHLGSLSRIRRIVKITGFVSSTAAFTQHPAVINGASDLLVAVFGDAGKHARSAVGVAALPMGASVELEMLVEVDTTG